MKIILSVNKVIYITFLLLIVSSVNVQAEWEGLDTVQVLSYDMRFNGYMDIWNGYVVFNGESSISLMGLNEYDEFTIFGEITNGHPYGRMQLYNDELYAITNNGLLVAELSGSEITVSGEYTLASIEDIAVVNGTCYCLIDGSNDVHRLSFNGGAVVIAESFNVSVNPIELISDGSLLCIKYYENQAFHLSVYSSENSELTLEYVTEGYSWPFEVIPYQDRIYMFNSNDYPNNYINRINPYNGNIEATINFSGYVSSEVSTFIRYGDNIVFFWYPPDEYEPRVRILNIPEFEWAGEYQLAYSMYPAFPYDENHLFQVVSGGDPGTTVFNLNIHEMTSDTESEFISTLSPLCFSIYNMFTEGNYTYIANGSVGSMIIKNIANDYTIHWVDSGNYTNTNIYKCGNYLYVNCGQTTGGYSYLLKVYDCTVPEETVLINTIGEGENAVVENVLEIGDFTIMVLLEVYDYSIRVYSHDLETLYSTREGGEQLFIYDNYIFNTQDGIVRVYEVNNQGQLELVYSGLDISGTFLNLVGNILYTSASSTINVYSLSDPLRPNLLHTVPLICEGYSLRIRSFLGDYFVGASYSSPPRDVILKLVDDEFEIVEDITPEDRYNTNSFSDSRYLYTTSPGGNLYVMEPRYTTSVSDHQSFIPEEYNFNIYPNPANAAASISFNLDHSGEVGFALYNVLGQQVFWTSQVYPQGNHTYSLAGNMAALASGTYYLGVTVGGQETVKKLTILK